VSPELAAKLQKGLGHKRCLEERGSGLGKMRLAQVLQFGAGG
jgi:hypothetical protein